MRRDEVIATLQANADTLRGFGVTALYLYGSAARDEASEVSDIDLFADVDYGRFGFVPYMELRDFLAALFRRSVDVTTRNALHPDLKSRIVKDAVKVFDEGQVGPVAAE
jgi:predicted nucleotidyltransferase